MKYLVNVTPQQAMRLNTHHLIIMCVDRYVFKRENYS